MNSSTTATAPAPAQASSSGLLWLALLLGCLRFLQLGEWSLWIDEAFMLADARHGGDALKPLSYIVFDWAYSLFEGRPSEWSMRLPAAVLGWLCVPATYWALAPLAGRRAAALSALVVALAPWQLYWAQNARYYTMVQLLGLLGTGGVVRGLKDGSRAWSFAGGLCLVAALATHPSALILGVALVLALLGCRVLSRDSAFRVGEHNRRLWLVFLVSCLLAPLLLMPHVGEVAERWNARQGHGDPLHLIKSAAYWFTPMVCLGALVAACGLLKSRRNLFLLLLPSLGLGVALVATYAFRVAAQYIFLLFPFFAALAVLPLAAPGRSLLRWGYAALLFAPLLLEDGLYFGLRNGDRPHWREAFAHVMQERRATDLVFAMEAPVGRYYWDPTKDDLRSGGEFSLLDSWTAEQPEEWRRYGRRMWFIINRDQTNDWSKADRRRFLLMLDSQCTLEARFEVPYTPRDLDVSVYLFEPGWEAAREAAR